MHEMIRPTDIDRQGPAADLERLRMDAETLRRMVSDCYSLQRFGTWESTRKAGAASVKRLQAELQIVDATIRHLERQDRRTA